MNNAINRSPANVGDDRLQRGEVAMDIRHHRQSHQFSFAGRSRATHAPLAFHRRQTDVSRPAVRTPPDERVQREALVRRAPTAAQPGSLASRRRPDVAGSRASTPACKVSARTPMQSRFCRSPKKVNSRVGVGMPAMSGEQVWADSEKPDPCFGARTSSRATSCGDAPRGSAGVRAVRSLLLAPGWVNVRHSGARWRSMRTSSRA